VIKKMIHVIGAGGIGMPLAALLADNEVPVTAVRTSTESIEPRMTDVVVDLVARTPQRVRVNTVSLSKINGTDGAILAVTAKATANRSIAPELFRCFGDLPLVVLQNGIDVEAPFTI
jgi:2-dehydropantoate 2-reductase